MFTMFIVTNFKMCLLKKIADLHINNAFVKVRTLNAYKRQF